MSAHSVPNQSDFASPSPGQRPEQSHRPGLTPVGLFIVLLITYLLVKVQFVLVLTLMALLFATVIERPVNELEKRRLPRGLSILVVYIALIGGLALISVSLVPVISQEAGTFRDQAPAQLHELEASWAHSGNPILSGPGHDLLGKMIDVIQRPPNPNQQTALNVILGVVGGIVGILTALIMAFYYLLEKELLRGLILAQLQPATRARVARVWNNVEAQVGHWLRGQLVLCLIIGVTATIGYGIIDVRFWPLLGLWSGVTEIIPIVGPWLGGIPAVIMALTQSWQKALIVAAFIVGLQAMENAVLVPRVMRGAVGLTPLTVFVAILAGTEFKGVPGAILAIPVAAAVQVILTDYLRTRREAAHGTEPSAAGWRWMLGHAAPGPSETEPAGVAKPEEESASEAPEPSPTRDPLGWTSHLLARVNRGNHDAEETPPASSTNERGTRHSITGPQE
jgi:predicted PurR-regulated permease PerM